jgi:hypothetical protein
VTASYGYSPDVGDWYGSIALPSTERTPIRAVRHAIQQLGTVLEPLHRPTEMRISWSELDAADAELAFHELETYPVTSWDGLLEQIERLASMTPHQFAIDCVFAELATRVVEIPGELWKTESAELQFSIVQPQLHPTTIEVHYTTYIDAWLSTTYDENHAPCDNHDVARANRPNLERLLEKLHQLTGATFRVGRSRLYPFAISEHGFRDVDDLPARGHGAS